MGQSETLYFSLFFLQYSDIQAIYMQLYSLCYKVTCINMVIRYQQWLTVFYLSCYIIILPTLFSIYWLIVMCLINKKKSLDAYGRMDSLKELNDPKHQIHHE